MILHFGMDSEFENTKICVQKKDTGTIWELSSCLHTAHMPHTNIHMHTQGLFSN